jgi:septal ring factor EnvC (AmiA/AmiB activator)
MVQNKTYQLKLSHLIIGGILLLLLLFLIYFRPTPTPINTYDKEKREIDSLKTEIVKFKKLNSVLDSKINKQQKVIDSLDIKISNTEKELTKTRTYYGNKIKDITSSSPAELNEFFTERYK